MLRKLSATLKLEKNLNPIRVACVGDSITEVSGYPFILQTLLDLGYVVGNFGSSGSTVSADSWKPYIDQPEFEEAQDFKPNIVIIMLGTNDNLMVPHIENSKFKDDYAKLIFTFQQLESKPQIWIVKPPPVFINSSDQNSTYFSQTIIPQTEELARRLGLPIIDLYNAFGNRPDFF